MTVFIKKYLQKMLEITRSVIIAVGMQLYTSPEEKRVAPWFAVNGDKTLRLDYQLCENSVVIDLGGYEGQWSSDIYARYNCLIHVFEPVPVFAHNITKRFELNPKIHVHNFGLGRENGEMSLAVAADGSSAFVSGKETITMQIVAAADFFRDNGLQCIDLMKINIEGGEYELLEHLIETGLIVNICNLQIQFHDFVQDAEIRMVAIQKQLEKTHSLTFQYPFVWENWARKN